tara:strand:- start:3880 stop:5703 length:1824 start_codon:yes stop_codon:yes gene_type:complete
MGFKNKRVPIDYTSRDYLSIRESLIDHAKRYYPDTFQDFNEAGFGSLMIDSVAYIGDIMSLYLDYQANEGFIETAIEEENILKIGRQMGYKNQGPSVSTGLVQIYIEIPANADGTPNTEYTPIVRKGSTFGSVDGGTFTLTEDVNFNDDNIDILVSKVSDATSVPTFYVLRASGEVTSGVQDIETLDVDDFVEFRKIEIGEDANGPIIEVLKVEDLEGNEYFQVDNLSQDIIHKGIVNKDTTTNKFVPNLLKPFLVPRRFTVERDASGKIFIQFGGGSDTDDVNDVVSDPSKVNLQMHGKEYISSTYFDPNSLAYRNTKLGIGPSNTSLNITYRLADGSASTSNAAANSVVTTIDVIMDFNDESSLDETLVGNVRASSEVDNSEAIVGDVNFPTTDELRQRIMSTFATQNRAVTREDYIYLSYAMPNQFGSIKRANMIKDPNSQRRNLNLYVISEDADGNLSASSTALKNNLKIWLDKYRMVNDTIDILDAKVVNIGVDFSVLADETFNKFDVLSAAVDKLTEDITKRKLDIGEDFSIIEIYKSLKELDEVVDVIDVELVIKSGDPYSDISFSIGDNLSSDGRVLICPQNAVFEIKLPESDIKGTVK